jgi:hypothetical protein
MADEFDDEFDDDLGGDDPLDIDDNDPDEDEDEFLGFLAGDFAADADFFGFFGF